jgi:hypothetical protein
MFRFRVESHISIMFRDLYFDASVGIDGAVSGRSSRTPVRRARELAADLEQFTTHAELLDLHPYSIDTTTTKPQKFIRFSPHRHGTELTSCPVDSPTRRLKSRFGINAGFGGMNLR